MTHLSSTPRRDARDLSAKIFRAGVAIREDDELAGIVEAWPRLGRDARRRIIRIAAQARPREPPDRPP